MATGDVRLFTATISGFDDDTTNPATAGWTQLVGTSDTGQSATKLTVLDNGLQRWTFDKNVAGVGSVKGYAFDGAAWQQTCANNSVSGLEFEVTGVNRNTATMVELAVRFKNIVPETFTGTVTMLVGIPALHFRLDSPGADTEWDLAFTIAGGCKTYLSARSGALFAGDVYGAVGTDQYTPTTQPFCLIPSPSKNLDILVVYSADEQFSVYRTSVQEFGYSLLASGDTPMHIWVATMPRTYTLGDGGGANVGNGDGQLREAEDNHTVVSGAYAVNADVNCSGAKKLANTAPANGHKITWSLNFPAAGIYYILVPQAAGTSTLTSKVTVTGATGTDNYTKTVPSDVFASDVVELLYGPYTVPAAGDRTVGLEIVALGSATAWEIDHASIFPYESTASSPTTFPFPKNLAHSLLRRVTPTA